MASVVYHVDHARSGYNYGVPSMEKAEVNPHTTPQRRKTNNGISRIKVCVRKRPLSKREARHDEDVVQVAMNQRQISVKEEKLAVDLRKVTLVHKFQFDDVFPEEFSNNAVYERTIKPFLPFVLKGGKATCFAFGQTGAGKTHTLLGDANGKGLYQFAAEDLFELLKRDKSSDGLMVWISYFEIYCGQLYDLLNKRERIQALENGKHQVCIAGVNEIPVSGSQGLTQYIEYGNNVRSQGSSGVNATSSRSHAVLQIQLKDVSGNKLGRLSVIDLAGSERACDRGDPDKATRLEGAEINTSLLSLKECIRAMDQDQLHTPFRQSKLTQVLKDSLLGESQTCMLASISPASSSLEDTLNTLRYADRVKEINKLKPSPGLTPKTFSPNTTSTPLKGQRGLNPSTTRRTSLPAQRSSLKASPVIDQKRRSSVQSPSTRGHGDTSRARPGPARTPKRKTRKDSGETSVSDNVRQLRNQNVGKDGLEMSPGIYREVINEDPSLMRDRIVRENVSFEAQRKFVNPSVGEDGPERFFAEATNVRLENGFDESNVVQVNVSKDEETRKQRNRMVENFLSNSLPVWEDEKVEVVKLMPPPNLSFSWEVDNPHYVEQRENEREESRREILEESKTFDIFSYENPRYIDKTDESHINHRRVDLNSSASYATKGFQTSTDDFTEPVQSWRGVNGSSPEEERDGAGSPSSVATDSTMELLAEINQSLRNSSVSPIPDLRKPLSLEGMTYTEPWKRESNSEERKRVSERIETSSLTSDQINFKQVTRTEGMSRNDEQSERKSSTVEGKRQTDSWENEVRSAQNGRRNGQRQSEIEKRVHARVGGPQITSRSDTTDHQFKNHGIAYHTASRRHELRLTTTELTHSSGTDTMDMIRNGNLPHEYSTQGGASHRRANSKETSKMAEGVRHEKDGRLHLDSPDGYSPGEVPKMEMIIQDGKEREKEKEDYLEGYFNGRSTIDGDRLIEHTRYFTSQDVKEIDIINGKIVFADNITSLDELKELKEQHDHVKQDGDKSGRNKTKEMFLSGREQTVNDSKTSKINQSLDRSPDRRSNGVHKGLSKFHADENVVHVPRNIPDSHVNGKIQKKPVSNSPPMRRKVSSKEGNRDKVLPEERREATQTDRVVRESDVEKTKRKMVTDACSNSQNNVQMGNNLRLSEGSPSVDIVDESTSEGFRVHETHENGGWCECCSVSVQKQLWSHNESQELEGISIDDKLRLYDHVASTADPQRRSSLQIGSPNSVKKRNLRQRKSLPWLAAPRFDDQDGKVLGRQSVDTTTGQKEMFVSSVTVNINGHSINRIPKDEDGEEKNGESAKTFEKLIPKKAPSEEDGGRDANVDGVGGDVSKPQDIPPAKDINTNSKDHNLKQKKRKHRPRNVNSPNQSEDVRDKMENASKKPSSPGMTIYSTGGYVPTVFSLTQLPLHVNSGQEAKREPKKRSLKDKMSEKGIESLPSPKGFLQKSGMSKRGDEEGVRGSDKRQRETTTWAETAQSKMTKEERNLKDARKNGSGGDGEEVTPTKAAFFRETLQPVSNQWQYVTIDGRSPVSKVKLTPSGSEYEISTDKQTVTNGQDIQADMTGYNGIGYSHVSNSLRRNDDNLVDVKVGMKEEREALDQDEGDLRRRESEIKSKDGRKDNGSPGGQASMTFERVMRNKMETEGLEQDTSRGIGPISRTEEGKAKGRSSPKHLRREIEDDVELNGSRELVRGNIEIIVESLETENRKSQDNQMYEICDDEQSLKEENKIQDRSLDVDWAGEERRLLSPIPEGRTDDEVDDAGDRDPRDDTRPNSASEKATHLLVRAHQEQLEELQQLCDSGWSIINRLQLGEWDVYKYLTDSNDLIESQQRCITTFKDQLSIYTHCSTPDSPLNREGPGIS
ncbi:uncharacterized protein [Apostichopus japonicus]|uniref:uncharacterized protein isoform X2 n=1 Tax=Stichopus japonicus TaxID=307972 RepID=UPI003AB1A47F